MALTTTTTATTQSRFVAALESKLGDTFLDKAFLIVLSTIAAGTHTTLHKFGSFALLQHFIEFCSFEEITVLGKTFRPLVFWGTLFGLDPPQEDSVSVYETTFSVLDQGETMTAGTLFVADNEQVYRLLADVDLDAAEVTGRIAPLTSDADDPLEVDDTISFVSPRSDVATSVTISSVESSIPGDTEESYREKVLDVAYARMQGGASIDYRVWAEKVSDVKAAFPYPADLPNEIELYVESKTTTDGIASNDLLASVKEGIDLDSSGIAAQRGINDAVNYFPITRVGYTVTITGFTGGAAEETALEEAISQYLLERRPFIVGLDRRPRRDIISQFGIGGIAQNVLSSFGVTYTSLAVDRGGATVVTEALGKGELAKLSSLVVS